MRTLTRAALCAAACLTLVAPVTAASASTAASAIAPPVWHTGGVQPATNYPVFIQSDKYGTGVTGLGATRAVLSTGTLYTHILTGYYTYNGVKYYQFKDDNNGLCLNTVGAGNASVNEATCSSSQTEYFSNGGTDPSEVGALYSSVFTGESYGLNATSSSGFAVNKISGGDNDYWNFIPCTGGVCSL